MISLWKHVFKLNLLQSCTHKSDLLFVLVGKFFLSFFRSFSFFFVISLTLVEAAFLLLLHIYKKDAPIAGINFLKKAATQQER